MLLIRLVYYLSKTIVRSLGKVIYDNLHNHLNETKESNVNSFIRTLMISFSQ
jgi:hypothetical protein